MAAVVRFERSGGCQAGAEQSHLARKDTGQGPEAARRDGAAGTGTENVPAGRRPGSVLAGLARSQRVEGLGCRAGL